MRPAGPARKKDAMAVMPKEVQDAFNQMKNIVLATATPDGVPNADPMGMKKVIDAETVYISDQFFNKTLANLKENQKVAITFWGDEGAYQIHGTATYINEGEQFEELKAWADGCFAAMGAPITAKGGVLVHVDELFTCSPAPTPARSSRNAAFST